MGIKTMTPTKQQVDELRNMFIEKYEKSPPAGKFKVQSSGFIGN